MQPAIAASSSSCTSEFEFDRMSPIYAHPFELSLFAPSTQLLAGSIGIAAGRITHIGQILNHLRWYAREIVKFLIWNPTVIVGSQIPWLRIDLRILNCYGHL